MKAKLTIFFSVALLPSIIYGLRKIDDYVENVKNVAQKGGRIEGIFQPEDDEPLGTGGVAFTFPGILFPSETKVAMKFTLSEHSSYAEKEYEIYTYLNAIDNPDVERYGIPSVYYYGKWYEHKLIMMGISLLEQSIQDLLTSKELLDNDVNVLIILRDFILSTKYMHSRAVRHDDIKIENIMVRKQRCFLIDFNLSAKMNQRNQLGTPKFVSRRAHTNGERYPKDDWESFLYSICYKLGAHFNWMGPWPPEEMYRRKSNKAAIIDEIKQIESNTLKNIFIKLAEHIFDDGKIKGSFYSASNSKRFPDYDRFYTLVNDEIEKLNLPPPVMFTWLTREQREEAIDDLNDHPIPNITEISDPKDYNFSTMAYPYVDFQKFTHGDVKNGNMKLVSKASASSFARNPISDDKSKNRGKISCFNCFACSSSKAKTRNRENGINK